MKSILCSTIALAMMTASAFAEESKLDVNPIVNYDGCTAFYIGDGRFVSAGHCVTPTPTTLVTENNLKIPAEVVAVSIPDLGMPDFIVLEAKGSYVTKRMKPLVLNCDYTPKTADFIYVKGYPKDLGFLTVEGRVASDKASPWHAWKKPVIRMAIMVINGNSGAPVLNRQEVIGIVVGGDLGGNPNLSVATPISDVCKVIGYAN